MKILFVQKEGGIFGAENYHLKTIPALLKKGVEVEFLRLYTNYQGGKGGNFINKLQDIGVKTHELNIGRYPDFGKFRKLHAIIHKGDYDIIHSHLIHADFYISMLKLFKGLPCTWVSTKHGYDNVFTARHGFDTSKQKLTPYFLIAKFSEYLVDKSYTISHGLHQFFIKTGLTTSKKMEMIHYGFDFNETLDDLLDARYKHFKKQLIIVGRLVSFKGHSYLIRALSELVKEDDSIGLVIVGTGEIQEVLKSQVAQLSLTNHVHFAGYSANAIQWMYNSDVVVVPSISEGFGVVFLEAFSSKKPVVAFNVPAGNELMEHGVTGYLAKPYNVNDLAEKIEYIFKHPEEGKAIANQAYKQLKDYFTLERMVNEILTFYKKTV